MTELRILQNMIRTPDGKILVSGSVHDYKSYTDKNGHNYTVDGGRSYLHRTLVNDAPYEELSLHEGDSHEKIRDGFTWGSRGVNGDQPIVFNLLKDLSTDHVTAIIGTQQHLEDYILEVFVNELDYRKNE